MAYIEPNSTIKLLTNCPLDNTYDHTIYFTSASAQTSYFESLTKYGYLEYSYVRQNRTLKVQAPVGANLYDCNYIMFKNTSFENKWFYAFIIHVEYVNNLTWEIQFELDVMQSWMFDYELEQCFVEREHSATDTIGDNLVPENLEIGDYISEGISKCIDGDDTSQSSSLLDPLSLVFACTFDENFQDYKGGFYSGVYSGLSYKVFDIPQNPTQTQINDLLTAVETWLSQATPKISGIVCSFLIPTCMVTTRTSPHPPRTNQFYKTKAYTDIDGYTPKNKKLFTYPYNFLYCTNFQGQSVAYHYEYFNVDLSHPDWCQFYLTGDFSPNPSVVLVPLGYKMDNDANYDEKLVLTGFPQVPFSTDVFKAWLANGAGDTVVNAISSVGHSAITGAVAGGVIGGVAGAGAGAVPGALLGAGVGVAHALVSVGEKLYQPPQAHSGAGSVTMAVTHMLDFGFMKKHIRAEFARIIDDYFNMYGYATHRCKIPNTHVRPHWTYTKTIGCCIVGSVPADDMKKICNIYNTGITFWRNGNEVGNYSLDNRPV